MNRLQGNLIDKLNSYFKNMSCPREHVTGSCSSHGPRTFSGVVSILKRFSCSIS